MNQKIKGLLQRRSELQMQSLRERMEFSRHFEPWEKPLSWVDNGIDAFHFVPVEQIGKLAASGVAGGNDAGQGAAANLKRLENERKQHTAKKPAMPIAMCVSEEPDAGDWHLHVRGEIRNLGPVVPRGFLQVATPVDLPVTLPKEVAGSGRVQLADWLGASQNPSSATVPSNATRRAPTDSIVRVTPSSSW